MSEFTLIWCGGSFKEQEWIRALFSGMNFSETCQEGFGLALARSIYVVNSNRSPLEHLPAPFLSSARELGSVGLFHCSDEWFGENYNVYSNFAFIYRNYLSQRFCKRGILVLPLGWPNQTASSSARLTQRSYHWSFIGSNVGIRKQMCHSLKGDLNSMVRLIDGKEGTVVGLPKLEYDKISSSTRFAPCPMGNVVEETWRFYEALEAGSVPIVQRKFTLDYYGALLGRHPIPTVRRWAEAKRLIERLANQPEGADLLQREVHDWWRRKKLDLIADVTAFTRQGLEAQYKEENQRRKFVRSTILRRTVQIVELLRNHSLNALFARLGLLLRDRRLWRVKSINEQN